MRLVRRFGCLVVSMLIVSGCTGLEKSNAAQFTPKGRHAFDLSSGSQTGKLLLQSRPPAKQFGIVKYGVSIDGRPPVEIYKHSDATFILDVGTHILKLYALSTDAMSLFKPGNQFGKAREESITINQNQTLVAEYTGPYSMFTDGSFEIIEERNV